MKRLSLLIIAVLFSVAAFAQQKLDTDFTQTKLIKVSGKTTNKSGHILYDGNDQLKMTYTNPQGDYFVVDGKNVKVNMDGKKADINASKVKKVELQCNTLLNCLSGKWEQAATDNNAELSIKEDKNMKTVSINAKGKVPKGGYKSVELDYRLSDGNLVKMVLEEANGIINTYEIK